jgi:hypothetical protein
MNMNMNMHLDKYMPMYLYICINMRMDKDIDLDMAMDTNMGKNKHEHEHEHVHVHVRLHEHGHQILKAFAISRSFKQRVKIATKMLGLLSQKQKHQSVTKCSVNWPGLIGIFFQVDRRYYLK